MELIEVGSKGEVNWTTASASMLIKGVRNFRAILAGSNLMMNGSYWVIIPLNLFPSSLFSDSRNSTVSIEFKTRMHNFYFPTHPQHGNWTHSIRYVC